MRITFSRNPFIKFQCWFENKILASMSEHYYINKKKHYRCTVCGHIVAPYFDEEMKCSLTYDMGWYRIAGSKRYICHECSDHGFADNTDERPIEERNYKWDEWQEIVKANNTKIINKIKRKDYTYYKEWFDNDDMLIGDRCVVCGEIVPEGRMVCWSCENMARN